MADFKHFPDPIEYTVNRVEDGNIHVAVSEDGKVVFIINGAPCIGFVPDVARRVAGSILQAADIADAKLATKQ